jgi:hypothetical protein
MLVALLAIHVARWYVLAPSQLAGGIHHVRHLELFGTGLPRWNRAVLGGVDRVQATAPDGGGYFIGVHAVPAESPVGYDLQILGKPLLKAPRATSYCSGSSYAAFIEALNQILSSRHEVLTDDRFEALRMQEPDGGRREDGVKMWGLWNADGAGSLFALVEYAHMGQRISPQEARPGDFMNISWKSGLGHSVVFLGWAKDPAGQPSVVYWSSQKGTNGYGDHISPISSVKDVVVVRLTHPEAVYKLNVAQPVVTKAEGDLVDIPSETFSIR